MIQCPTTLDEAREMLNLASINWDKATEHESQCRYGAAKRSRYMARVLVHRVEKFLWGSYRKKKVLMIRNRLVQSSNLLKLPGM